MVCPRNTNPRKNGMTPNKNISRLFQDFDRVAVMMLRLLVY